MEHDPRNRSNDRGRMFIPSRGNSRSFTPEPPLPQPKIPAAPTKEKMASDREQFGFNDIPVDDGDMEHVRFRDIMNAWIRQAIKHSPLEDKLKNASTRTKRLNELKNDIKWAMQADLDEPVKPVKKTLIEQPKPEQKEIETKRDNLQEARPHSSSSADKTIDINISFGSLPKFPSLKSLYSSRLRPAAISFWTFISSKKKIVVPLCALIVIGIVSAGAAPLVTHYINPESSQNTKKTNDESPEYTTLLPKNTSVSELGGWKRVSPPESNPVYAYADKISDTTISVSQQPVPDSFKPNVNDRVAELAKSFSAKDEIDAGGTKLYIGTSSKGPQSVVLVKDNTLVLIKSQAKISNEAWISYVQQLNKN